MKNEDPDRMEPPISVVVNAAAGLRRRDVGTRIEQALAEVGVSARVETVSPDRLGQTIERAVERAPRQLAMAGGDGTQLMAAQRLAGTPVALAPVPTGTLNHFARRLRLEGLQRAAEAIKAGNIVTVPLGIVDDEVFLNTATFGFYADMVRRRERFRRALGKWPAAFVAFLATTARLRIMDVTLVVDGKTLERRTALVWVGLGWGSFPLVHEAPERRSSPDLEIVILRPEGVARSIGLIFRMLLNLRRRDRPVDDPVLEVLHARQMLIHGQHRIGVTLDGEVLRCEPPILVALQENALRVVTGYSEDSMDEKDRAAVPTGNPASAK